jgi:CBS domain-containing protein
MKVTTIMSSPVFTVPPEAPVKEAARLLIEHSISALPVVDASGKLVGIVSEADLLPMETRPDPRTQATPIPPTSGSSPRRVSDVMTRTVISINSESEVSQAARLMIEADVKRLPVVDGDQLVGIVSRRDLVKVIARRDEDVQAELARRLSDVGLELSDGAVKVTEGIASIELGDSDPSRRLAESVALTVAGVLEVRFQA